MKEFLGFFLLSSILLLGGCVIPAKGVYDPKDASRSVVFGFVDMSEAPLNADIDDVILARLDVKKPQMIRAFPDYLDGVTVNPRRPGYFWANDLVPGQYQLAEIAAVVMRGGNSTNAAYGAAGGYVRNVFSFPPDQRNATFVNIQKPGLYYLGAYKLTGDGKGFRFDRIKRPMEKEALQRLLHRNYSPYWKPIIENRLADLTDQRKASKTLSKTGK